MKLPLKHIIILVICSLTGIFVYQTYWLTGLYRTMKQEMNNNIKDAMRTSDFNEIVLRVNELQKDNVEHGSVTVSAGQARPSLIRTVPTKTPCIHARKQQ